MKRPITFSLLIAVLLCCLISSCSDNNKNDDGEIIGGGTPHTIISLRSVEWTQNNRTDSLVYSYESNFKPTQNSYYEGENLVYQQIVKYLDENYYAYIEKTVGDKTVSLYTYKAYQDKEGSKLLRTCKMENISVTDTIYLGTRGMKSSIVKGDMMVEPFIGEIHYENESIDKFEYDENGNLFKITGDDAITVYTYDDKKGFGLSLNSYQSVWLFYCSDIPFNGYTNLRNNKLSKTVSYKNGEEETYLYTYTYDSDNLPLTMSTDYTRKDKDGQVIKTDKTEYKFTFNKKILY